MNRETYPAAQSPLTGDVSGAAGAQSVTVVGLQRNPVAATTPNDQNVLRWISGDTQWEPSEDGNGCIQVNSAHVSDDFLIYVNGTFVKVNGVVVD
jgi:hypothetical protein